jgi:hypothetical membrane protein
MKTRWLLYPGFLIPIVFWATVMVCGSIMGNYNHFTRLVSELGAIGTGSQYFFTTGLLICSLLSIFFVAGLYKTAKQSGINPIPVLIILTYSVSICGAALFPLPQRLHGILGMPSVLLFLSPFSCLFLWRTEVIPGIKPVAWVTFLIMSLGFLAFMPTVLSEYTGLKQRLFHLGWTIWFIYLSSAFIGINKKLSETNSTAPSPD